MTEIQHNTQITLITPEKKKDIIFFNFKCLHGKKNTMGVHFWLHSSI